MSGRHRWADRDDELVQALADRRGVPAGHCGDDLAAVLAAWVEAVDTDLPPPGPVAAPAGSRRYYGLRTALLRAAVAAGIVAAVTAGGLAAAERAQPGSPLWSLSRLVDPDRAASLEARRLVTQSLLLAERDA